MIALYYNGNNDTISSNSITIDKEDNNDNHKGNISDSDNENNTRNNIAINVIKTQKIIISTTERIGIIFSLTQVI